MRKLLLALLVFSLASTALIAQEINLHGQHAATTDDDAPEFADPLYDDSAWQRSEVPLSLRSAGFDGRPDVYWYRISFWVPEDWSSASPAIRLGVITRSDETYLNGTRIGGLGKIGPRLSVWHAYAPLSPRLYPFDPNILKPGEYNVLAIRGAREPYIDDGGIITGPVSLVALPHSLNEFLEQQSRFVSYRYLFFGIETMIFLGIVIAILLGIRSRFLVLFGLFYFPAYLFTMERRGVAALFGLDGPGTQFVADFFGALALPALIEFVAFLLRRPVGRLGRSIQVLSVITLISIPNTNVPALQWWAIESNVIWHVLMLLSLLVVAIWTLQAVVRGTPYATVVCFGLVAMLAGVALDIASPLNVLERDYGIRIGEIGILVLYLSFAFMVVRSISDREASLHAANAHITQVHEKERARMAQDLHDGIGQWLTAIKIKLDLLNARSASDTPDQPRHLEDVSADVSGAIEDVRRVAHDLAPALLEQRGLVGAINAHASRAGAGGQIELTVTASGSIALDPTATTHVFRIFQEAVTNALRHSGCQRVAISLEQTGDQFRMEISDDGRGFDSVQSPQDITLGLASMRSRASLLGGQLDIGANEFGGVSVVLIVPLNAQARSLP